MQLTLKAIRESYGYTVEEVADSCGMSVKIYSEIEIDPSQALLSLVHKIANIYGVSLNLIFPGTEEHCIKYNQSQKTLTTF